MYQVVSQIITQLCICVLLSVIYTAISLSYISKNKLSYNNTHSDKALKNIMFYLLIIMCAIYNNGGDYYAYRKWFLYGYGETANTDDWVEPIYYWIKSVLPPYFILFRLVIWGTGIFVYKKLCEKIGINLILAYILFGVFYTSAYSYARASLGIMIISYAFVMFFKNESKSKIYYLKVLLLFAFATLLHKSCLSLIFILFLSLFLKLNKKTLILLVVMFTPLSMVLDSSLGIISENIGLSDIQSERYFKTDGVSVERSSAINYFYPILILLSISIYKLFKNRKQLPRYIKRITLATIAILYAASLLSTMNITLAQTISLRFYLMAFVLGLVCIAFVIQNIGIKKNILIALIVWDVLFRLYAIVTTIKYGAPQLVESFY